MVQRPTPIDPAADVLPVALRVWAQRTDENEPDVGHDEPGASKRGRRRHRRYPSEELAFDTETLDETSQRLMLGVWRFYRGTPNAAQPGKTCIEEGFFYPDDLPVRDPAGWARLQQYVSTHQAAVAPGFPPALRCVPLSWWLEHRLYRYGFKHRNRCTIVGFNLPFDFGALAAHWAPAGARYRGGWSLGLWGSFDDHGTWHDQLHHPRLLLRAIDPRRTLFGWGSTGTRARRTGSRAAPATGDEPELRGYRRFVDLRTLVFALTDRSHTLESACAAFGDRYVKPDVTYGVIDERMLHYAREDVRHTAELYRSCLTELGKHRGVDMQPHALYSPAGVGAAYLRAMRVTPPLEQFSDLDPRVLGWSMTAFYGGRAEARIVRTPVPVVVADFTSMYPAVNALLGTWPVLTADRLEPTDVTEDVRALVAAHDLTERLFDPATWREDVGITLVQLDHPRGVILPVRAGYDPGARDYGIAVIPLTYDGQLWYTLPDVLAAAILAEAPVAISRALRLIPRGQQKGLRPVPLRGGREVHPRSGHNPFVAMIEERHRIKHTTDMDPDEQKRLDLFLKITANATAYGSLARFDRRDEIKRVPVTVYGPGNDGFPDRTQHPEDPGPYCFPPVAASISAGARLMLALIERLVTDVGGTYAFMDTDSIAIVATPAGGAVPCPTADADTVTALSHSQVGQVLRRFESLNPYGADVVNDDPSLGRSPWKVEYHSLDDEIWCYAIATKRYALYHSTTSGPRLVTVIDEPEESAADEETAPDLVGDAMVDWSEHGLGLYLDPTDEQSRDGQGRRKWISDAWQWILTAALTDVALPLPSWANRYALTQFTVSSPRHARWFRLAETGSHKGGKPRPFGFGLLGHVDPFAAGLVDGHPAAPYDRTPPSWPALSWYDRRSGNRITAVNASDLGDDPGVLAETLTSGGIPLRTIGDVLNKYGDRPEHKSLSCDGQPGAADSSGQLMRRPVRSAPALTAYIGKEGNRLVERAIGEVNDPHDYRNTYTHPDLDPWALLVLPVLRDIREEVGTKHIAAWVGVSDRQVRNWLSGRDEPHSGASRNRQRAEKLSVKWAAERLREKDRPVPTDPYGVLYAYAVCDD